MFRYRALQDALLAKSLLTPHLSKQVACRATGFGGLLCRLRRRKSFRGAEKQSEIWLENNFIDKNYKWQTLIRLDATRFQM